MGTIQQLYLMTTDLEAARTFYEDSLGLEPTDTGETSVAYATGDCELKLQQDFEPDALEEFNLSPPPSSNRGAGGVQVLSIDRPLDELYAQMSRALETSAGELLTEPRDVSWGERMFLAKDPDGYVWEIRAAENS